MLFAFLEHKFNVSFLTSLSVAFEKFLFYCKNRNKILLPDDRGKRETQSCNKLVYSFFLQSDIYI